MSSFLSTQHYSPFLVLLVGLSTFVGLWGLGTVLLSAFRVRLPAPWDQVTAVLLGIQALSLTVQVAAMAEIASIAALRGIWWMLIVQGSFMLLIRTRSTAFMRLLPPCTRCGPAILLIAIIAAAILINALVAVAPSTKIDELYYHMLVPSRIVSDGMLHFYREPWLGAMWPQMVYQITAAPTHAIGVPDATNIVSWSLSVTLLWFAWRIIRANANTLTWTTLCVASLCVGVYPVVWHVTGGAHAMGDLAIAAAVVAFCLRERLLAAVPPIAFCFMLSILLLSAATSKLSLIPISGMLLCGGLWPLIKSGAPLTRLQVLLAAAAPWIIFFCPIVFWTWAHAGSPFGPVLTGLHNFEAERNTSELPFFLVRNIALGYSPFIWLGAIGAIFTSGLDKARRIFLTCLVALQSLLIFWLLPYDVRYFTLHYGLFIVFAFFGPFATSEQLHSARGAFLAAAVFLLPWLAIQTYYAKQFVSVSMGVGKNAFYQRYIALYADYVALDRLLPKDAILFLFAPGFRISAVYAPRRIFLDEGDLPPGKSVAMITLQETDPGYVLKNYKIGEEIYENRQAILGAYRTPGRAPLVGSIKAVKLIQTE